jgi:hypothetical protein
MIYCEPKHPNKKPEILSQQRFTAFTATSANAIETIALPCHAIKHCKLTLQLVKITLPTVKR